MPLYIYIQVSVRDITLECLQITPTKFLGNLHNYILPTKFHEILFSSFRGVALTNCVMDRRTDRQDKNNMSPHQWGET